jgi:hypothetical protein
MISAEQRELSGEVRNVRANHQDGIWSATDKVEVTGEIYKK